MSNKLFTLLCVTAIFTATQAQTTIVYHTAVTDTGGNLLPWYNPSLSSSYNHCLDLVWNFWKNVPDSGGTKYYMTDHSYSEQRSGNKIGGDQFAMALSSWALYYAYTGDTALVNNMVYIADWYLDHSLSNVFDAWPNIPFPSNYSNTLSPVYDGDFISGAGVTQPDKAASFAAELINLYKITGNNNYLQKSIDIANTLADHVIPGDSTHSPFPFRVNAQNGNIPTFPVAWTYCGNVGPQLRLFEELSARGLGNVVKYDSAYAKIKRWAQRYPVQNDNWGSFFEDIPLPSNTETNAVTTATYMLEHPDWSPTYLQDARHVLDWTLGFFGSHAYDTFKVTAIYEQSLDMKEGSSHTARYASAELLYAAKTGDTSRVAQALKQLSWSTYLVDFDGKCRFSPQSGSVWYTDGYGDFVRHYLRAMAWYPAIAPDSANHLLSTTSVITNIVYQPQKIEYFTFDTAANELLKLTAKPLQVRAGGIVLNEVSTLNAEGWTWTPAGNAGLLNIRHNNAKQVEVLWTLTGIDNTVAQDLTMDIYPNPAGDMLTIACNTTATMAEVTVRDLAGRMVMLQRANFTAGKIQLSTTGLPAGLYTLQLQAGAGSAVKKLVKK